MTYRLPAKLTIDSSVLIKALVPPRKRKEDDNYRQRMLLHTKALKIFEDVVHKKIVSSPKCMVLTNPSKFYHILYSQETINYPF
jgi:hypothetical protein